MNLIDKKSSPKRIAFMIGAAALLGYGLKSAMDPIGPVYDHERTRRRPVEGMQFINKTIDNYNHAYNHVREGNKDKYLNGFIQQKEIVATGYAEYLYADYQLRKAKHAGGKDIKKLNDLSTKRKGKLIYHSINIRNLEIIVSSMNGYVDALDRAAPPELKLLPGVIPTLKKYNAAHEIKLAKEAGKKTYDWRLAEEMAKDSKFKLTHP